MKASENTAVIVFAVYRENRTLLILLEASDVVVMGNIKCSSGSEDLEAIAWQKKSYTHSFTLTPNVLINQDMFGSLVLQWN